MLPRIEEVLAEAGAGVFFGEKFQRGLQALLIFYRAQERIGLQLCHPREHVLDREALGIQIGLQFRESNRRRHRSAGIRSHRIRRRDGLAVAELQVIDIDLAVAHRLVALDGA